MSGPSEGRKEQSSAETGGVESLAGCLARPRMPGKAAEQQEVGEEEARGRAGDGGSQGPGEDRWVSGQM